MQTTLLEIVNVFAAHGEGMAVGQLRGLRTARWSYGEIARSAYQVARELEHHGIQKQDRVLLCGANSAEWMAIFFGCAIAGAIVVPLDVESEAGFVARVQQQVNARLAILDYELEAPSQLEIPKHTLEEFISLARGQSPAPCPAHIDVDDTVEIVFTSGTTGEPKGVRITHRNLLANLNALAPEVQRYLKWERLVHPIRFLNLVPLSHVFGQFMAMLVPQLIGGEVFFQSSLNSTQIIETVKRERISVIVGVPRVLAILRERIERTYEERGELEEFRRRFAEAQKSHFLSRWWTFRQIHRMFGWKFWAIISGGATLDEDIETFWGRLGFAVIQGYGLTETAALISVNNPFKTTRRSIGRFLPGQEAKLAQDGELLVRGENVSPGYWRGETSTAEADDGWFHTGDIAEMDAEGNLFFKGRKKEVIVTSAGVNIYPEDLEAVLNRDGRVKASAVVEMQTAQGPEALAVLILENDSSEASSVAGEANETLAAHQKIRRWFVWPEDDFPRTATQKIRKQIVGERVKQYLAGTEPISSARESIAGVLEGLGKHVDLADPAAKLGVDLQLDSLARVELLGAIEDRYQIEIDEAAFTDTTTLSDIEKIIHRGVRSEEVRYPYPHWQQKWPINWLRIGLLHTIVFTAIRLLGWPRIRGAEHLRDLSSPAIFIANHVTMLDHALILFALPARFSAKMVIAQDGEIVRNWRFPPAGTSLFERLLGWLEYFSVVFFFNVFSMPQKSGFRRSFKFAGEMIDHGNNLMIFPEGERTKHGAMNPFRAGTGLLVRELDLPVVPIRIDELWKLKQAHRHLAKPREIELIIGNPVRYRKSDTAQQIADDLFERVKSL